MKLRLGGHAAIELAVELVGADLARQIDDEGLRERRHFVVLRHHRRIGHIFDWPELEQRIVVEKIVEPARADGEARDDLAGMQRLVAPGDDALLDEIENGVGDQVGVNAEIAAMVEMLQRLVRNAPEIDMQRGAVLDDLRDVAGDPFGHGVGGLMRVFDQRPVGADKAVDPVDMQKGVAERPRHGGIDLGDDGLGVPQARSKRCRPRCRG